jgi:hypothetical protein
MWVGGVEMVEKREYTNDGRLGYIQAGRGIFFCLAFSACALTSLIGTCDSR